MQIRKALPADAKYIALLGRITFSEAFKQYFLDKNDLAEYLSYTFSVAKISRSIAKDNNIYWLAWIDDLPVGYAKIKKQSASGFCGSTRSSQLQKIYVLHDFQHLGIGKALLQVSVSEAITCGSDTLWLSVLKSNNSARIFYEKSEFKPVGSHVFSIGKETFDFSVMQLSLLK